MASMTKGKTRSFEIELNRDFSDEEMFRIHRYIRRMFGTSLMQTKTKVGGLY